jgi:hypothetical protein
MFPLRIIKSRATFDDLLDHLATESRRAEDNWHFWGAIDTACVDCFRELNQTPQFWNATRRAFQDSVILRLGRLFDPNNGALSLGNFLTTIHKHAKENSLGSLGLDVPGLDITGLEKELKTVSKDDPLVKALMEIRNEYSAHREAHLVARGSFSLLATLSQDDIRTLLNLSMRIVDKYCRLYNRPLVLIHFPERDDYKRMLKLLKVGLECTEKRNEAKMDG